MVPLLQRGMIALRNNMVGVERLTALTQRRRWFKATDLHLLQTWESLMVASVRSKENSVACMTQCFIISRISSVGSLPMGDILKRERVWRDKNERDVQRSTRDSSTRMEDTVGSNGQWSHNATTAEWDSQLLRVKSEGIKLNIRYDVCLALWYKERQLTKILRLFDSGWLYQSGHSNKEILKEKMLISKRSSESDLAPLHCLLTFKQHIMTWFQQWLVWKTLEVRLAWAQLVTIGGNFRLKVNLNGCGRWWWTFYHAKTQEKNETPPWSVKHVDST